ncbi:iron chelate uptake ABC transporter family permease subunit [Salipiger sp. PrR002]|uniref:FecCD family ABC transporter permease n=1 Tax=Salipiger sp. PrR002 TaxID=2706489 RepID=UPI0013BCCD71|nr:iron ABC transporter permease [Salipiger sp. PrR002]NDW00711.1 iron ABC transporter permease [Salipiger sp. PrR002]NDW57694.1 iron ABC transporter permease [Salipiger sp. PrR004]
MRGALTLGLLLLAATLAALALGQVRLSPALLWQGLSTGEGPGALVLGTIRGPRVLTALGAGAVLGMSGALFQSLFRNPLAAPDIMGFTAGAGLTIIAAIALGLSLPLPLIAAGGGLLAALLVVALSHRRGHATPPLTMILVGLGVGFVASALSSFLLTLLPHTQAAEAQRWLTGSLAARDWNHALQVWAVGGVLGALALAQMRRLAALQLGEDLAAGLGLRVGAARLALAGTGVLLAAAGVAVAGPVPFVALMAGPLGIRLVAARQLHTRLLAAAATGALVLVLADLAARAALPGIQLPTGVMTGLLGAPYLLWRLSREMEKGEL